jgi:hypothetical protein
MITPKSQREIVQSFALRLAGAMVALTDLVPIAVLRQLLEAIADEIADLNAGLIEAINGWYLQTAQGADLTRRLADYGDIPFPTAEPAYNTALIVTVSAPTDVQPGILVQTNPLDGSTPKQYQVAVNSNPDANVGDLGDGSWHITDSRTIDILAVEAGSIGNTPAGTITQPVGTIANLQNLSNLPLTNGIDAPTDPELREFFKSWLAALSGDPFFLASTFVDPVSGRRVASAAVQEWDGTRWLTDASGRRVAMIVYIDEGVGGTAPGADTASFTLVNVLQQMLDGTTVVHPVPTGAPAFQGKRDGGVPTTVIAARAVIIPVDCDLDVVRGTNAGTVVANAQAAVLRFFAKLPVAGQTLTGLQGQFYQPNLARALVDVPGALEVRFRSPVTDIAIPIGWKAVAGIISIKPVAVGG